MRRVSKRTGSGISRNNGSPGERTRPSAPSTGSGQASGCEGGVRAARRGTPRSYLIETLRVSRRRAFRTGRPSAGIGRRQPSASQASGRPRNPLGCPARCRPSDRHRTRRGRMRGIMRPPEMTGHKFFEIGRRGAAGLGVAKMNACRLGPNPSPSTGQVGNPAASLWRPLSRLLSKSVLSERHCWRADGEADANDQIAVRGARPGRIPPLA